MISYGTFAALFIDRMQCCLWVRLCRDPLQIWLTEIIGLQVPVYKEYITLTLKSIVLFNKVSLLTE